MDKVPFTTVDYIVLNFFQAMAELVKMQRDNMEQAEKCKAKNLWFLRLGTHLKQVLMIQADAF